MNASKTPRWSQHCWSPLRAVKNTVSYLAGPIHVARRLYGQWITALPEPVASVLFLCHGNICRSPFAATYFRSLLMKRGMSLTVRSAGLDTTPGKPAHSNSKIVAEQHQLSLDEHVTTLLHSDLVNQSDLIIVMEIAQKYRVQRLYPGSRGKVVLLGYFHPEGPLEIADPFGTPLDNFQICFQQVTRCCDNLADRLALTSSKSFADHATINSPQDV